MSVLTRFFFFFGDVFFLNSSILISFFYDDGGGGGNFTDKVYLYIFSNLAWLYLTLVSNPYNLNKAWFLSKVAKTQLAFLFIHLLVVASLILFLNKHYSLTQIVFMYLIFVPLFFGWKILIYYLRKIFTNELKHKNYLIIGRNDVSDRIRKFYFANQDLGYRFLGYLDLKEDKDVLINEIRGICQIQEIHEIFCCSIGLSNEALRPLVKFGLDSLIKVRVIVDAFPSPNTIQLDRYDFDWGKNIPIIPLDEFRSQFIKRVFDILFSGAFLILFMSWLLPIIAIIIKINSRGPIFFVQLRSGKDNLPFKCLKFRTMLVNIESDRKQATKSDPRVTPVGSFLRRSSIDELPQFINVFLGSMSVVGPRPHMLRHTQEYSRLIEKFMGRQYVKPGITGLAQCMGYRGETQTLADMENRVRLDRYYIENWSFWLDIKIIFLTVISLIRGSDKAY